jgi:hypothetical protein
MAHLVSCLLVNDMGYREQYLAIYFAEYILTNPIPLRLQKFITNFGSSSIFIGVIFYVSVLLKHSTNVQSPCLFSMMPSMYWTSLMFL